MRLEQSFTVQAPIERVWAALIDVERVAPCLPGAEITEAGADGVYRGTFTVRLGPTSAAYRGELRMESVDEAAHAVTMQANGQDKRGQGGAKATIVSRLVADGDATRVDSVTDFSITGRLARFGRGGMIQDVSNRLLREFSACLQAQIEAEGGAAAGEPGAPPPQGAPPPAVGEGAPPPPAPARSAAAAARPIRGFSLLLSVLWERIRRLLGRR